MNIAVAIKYSGVSMSTLSANKEFIIALASANPHMNEAIVRIVHILSKVAGLGTAPSQLGSEPSVLLPYAPAIGLFT